MRKDTPSPPFCLFVVNSFIALKACKVMTILDSILKTRHYFANKGWPSQSYRFCNSHVWMWKLNYQESSVPKNWCFWTVVLEKKTLESPLDSTEIQPVHPTGDQSWIFIGRADAEAEIPILWPPDPKNWLRWEEKVTTRGWDSWMVSPTQWAWVWVNSGSWWWAGRLGVLQSMGSQRAGHQLATELNWRLWCSCWVIF